MRLLPRYVLLEVVTVFLLTLAAMSALIFVGLLGREAVDRGLSFGPLVRMLPYLAPQALQFAVPAALLLATTSVYGRISASNELVAIKAAGVSPWKMVTPTLWFAALASLGNVLLNDVAVSWGRNGVDRVFMESLEEVVYGQLRIHREYSLPEIQIAVRRVEERKLIQPTVTVSTGAASPWTISAAWAELKSDPVGRRLLIRFHDMDLDGRVEYSDPSTFEYAISLDELSGKSRSTSTYSLAELGPATRSARAAARRRGEEASARATLGLLSGDFSTLTGATWYAVDGEYLGAEAMVCRLKTEPYRRWSNGFSCLSFAMVGAPLAALRRKGDFLASFFICFMPILMIYYPMLAVAVDWAKDGAAPPIGVWLGNVVLAIWGLWLMRWVVRY